MKEQSTFYSERMVAGILKNIKKSAWAEQVRDNIVEKARYWVKLGDEEIWSLMFGNTIMRSWSVWSDGFCPSCRKAVVMYNWVADPLRHPWKMECPNCGELFPKNDFYKYYASGLNENGVFSFGLADGSLLFNEEHPDKDDPLHLFGVDDGNGYKEGGDTWRFIGTYLIYGQWKRVVLQGLNILSSAYVVTADGKYAHKAGILLDRVADLYSTFDFTRDGILYEGKNICPGYVSYCVDACVETREIIIAYDRIFDWMKKDAELIKFLCEKAAKGRGNAVKKSFADIQRNIETNILQDVLDHPEKTDCNYPNTDATYIIARMVKDWKKDREAIIGSVRAMAKRSTAVNGVTGEKGLATYSAWTIQVFAEFLGFCCFADEGFLKEMFEEFPQIHDTYRFHIDTWCLDRYYPLVGDTGHFAKPESRYLGVLLHRENGVEPSMFTFLWKLYELTGDADFLKLMYRHNGNSARGLPYDLTCENPGRIEEAVQAAIDREGSDLVHASVNKEQWGIAVLASGRGKDSRAVWMHYDTQRDHYHMDGMNIGLYGKGLDLMPDFGYPPVQYGGWYTPQVYWYQGTASHNTVMVDRENQKLIENFKPKVNLWSIGECFKAIRTSEPRFVGGKQYERTLMLIDISGQDSYVADIFRVAGGKEHIRFMHSSLSSMTVEGVRLQGTDDIEAHGVMRNFKADMSPAPGWHADWKLEPGSLVPGFREDVHVRYTDATRDAKAYTAEAWVALDGYASRNEAWIPRIMSIRKRKDEPLFQTAFAGVIESYCGEPKLAAVKRLDLSYEMGLPAADAEVAIQIDHVDGKSDLIIARDVEDPAGHRNRAGSARVIQKEWDVRTDCELLMVRRKKDGSIEKIVMCKGSSAYRNAAIRKYIRKRNLS